MLQPCKLLKEGSTSAVKYCGIGRDVISELPDDVIYLIIKNLTLKDAVKASVLSHRWMGICCYLKDLKFDWVNMFQDSGNFYFLENCASPCREYRNKFVRAVNQFLDSYNGVKVRKFRVSFCLGCDFKDDIDRWISFAIRMDAQELAVNLYCDKCCCKRDNDKHGSQIVGKYVFSSELFEGRKDSNLQYMKLVGCNLGPNFTSQFSCLKILRLAYVPLALYDMESMFSCMVNLKDLIFMNCNLPATLRFGSLTLLECLYISSCRGRTKIEFSNANLLKFGCCYSPDIAFELSGAPSLKTFSGASKSQLQYVFTQMSEHVPKLKALGVKTSAKWVKIPENITIFRKVTNLMLIFNGTGKFDIVKMISILRAFPYLRKLTLETSCSEDLKEEKIEPSEYVHKHLKEVDFCGFYVTSNQIEFAIYLLNHAISLKQLVIKPRANFITATRQSWDEGEREMVYGKLLEFSKDVVLTISE